MIFSSDTFCCWKSHARCWFLLREPGSRALTPPIIHLRLGLLTALLREREIIDVAYRAPSVVSGRIIRVEMSVPAKPGRQIRIGQKLASKCNQIRSTFLKPALCGVVIEATCDDQGAAEFLAHQIQHPDSTGI